MNNNEIQNITPITNNNINSQSTNNIESISSINNFQQNVQSISTNTNSQIINDDFAHGLPEWDLVPPYTAVRRVNRK